MNHLKKLVQKNILAAITLAFIAQASASAFSGALLKGVKVELAGNNSYQVTVKTDKDVPIKKYVTASNQVVLDLQNVRPAQFINTVYNGATEIDHVIVQPSSGNKLRIFLQGLNIASSKIILDTRDEALGFLNQKPHMEQVILDMSKKTPKEINKVTPITSDEPIFIDLSEKKASKAAINKPVEKVRSVTPIISYEERSRNNLQSVKNSMGAGATLNSIFNGNTFDWVLRTLMLVVVVLGALKLFRKPKKVQINLASEKMKTREANLHKTAESQKERITKSLGMPGAKQNPRRQNYSSVSQYGLKEYQNSQLPPRKTNQALPERSKFTTRTSQAKASRNVNAQKPLKARPNGATKVTQRHVDTARRDFDGTKFLETMASIYQKSGREDLASGIRQKMIKNQKAS